MSEPVPRTPFLVKLDENNLRDVATRIEQLEPYIAEYKELVKRRRFLETRLGVISKAERIRRLLAQHPKGLSRAIIKEETDLRDNSLSGVLGELKQQGHIDQPERGIYRLTDVGNAATNS